jgi:predicted esterase
MQAFSKLEPDTSLAIVKSVWRKIPSPETRLYLFNMLQDHPRVLEIIHLGTGDPSLHVQNRALQVLEMYSFESFAEDFSSYLAWRAKQSGRTLEDTIRESCRDYIQKVNKADEQQRPQLLAVLQRIAYNLSSTANPRVRRKAMLESGLPDALAAWINNPPTAWTAFAVLRNLRMDEAYLRKVVLPLTERRQDVNYRRQAIGVLAVPDNRWAADILLKMLVQEYPDPESENIAYALTQTADAKALPTLIAMLEADKSPDGLRILGNILNLMTGNNSGQMHDGAWWRTWWARNASRFTAEVAAMPIPQIVVRSRATAQSQTGGPEQHQIAGDFKRTYWLVRPPEFVRNRQVGGGVVAPPAPPRPDGAVKAAGDVQGPARDQRPGLLVVLPPDGNGAEAALFWQEVLQKSLKNRYIIAVASAPKWSATQSKIWVTSEEIKEVKEAKFSTERFAAEIVQDVTANHAVDAGRIFLHGAAESGTAVYAASLEESTPFRGFYVLSAGFKSAGLPPMARAKNRRYLIEHSRDDKAAPYIMAAAAQKVLSEHGAAVKLLPYQGTHGYRFTDPAADPIAEAMAWLEEPQK